MSAVWPSTLPQLPLPGWDETAQPNVIESDMASGPPKRRRRSTRQRVFQTTDMQFTGTQKITFDAFWEVIKHGVEPFEWLDMETGVVAEFRFVEPKKPAFRNITPAPDADLRWYAATLKLERI